MFHPHRWTLRTRLITVMVALVAMASVVIGGVMTVFIRSSLYSEFDTTLSSTAQRVAHGVPGTERNLVEPGTVVGLYLADGTSDVYYFPTSTSSGTQLTGKIPDQIETSAGDSPAGADVTLPSYGQYRFVSVRQFDPSAGTAYTIVVGQPVASLEGRIAKVVVLVAIVVLGAIVLAAVIGAFMISRSLRSLRRVAGVARTVASMPLEHGDVDLSVRVPASDTDEHTEVGQVGAALNGLLESVGTALTVRQASEQKVRTFVADASHELRTPLASIRGYAELTRRFGGELSDDARHNIDRIESETKRMTSLVEDLLLLARLDAQRELETGEVDLSRLLVDVVSDAHAAGRDHQWELDLPDEPITIQGDDARLHQVFANLLANARVHTPADTSVTVSLDQNRSGEVVVRVRDSGPGIPAELQPTLFERFVRGDSSRVRTTGSTGLGLSIVSAVVQAHNGSVTVESEPGSTVFTVRLPADPATTTAPTRSAPVAV